LHLTNFYFPPRISPYPSPPFSYSFVRNRQSGRQKGKLISRIQLITTLCNSYFYTILTNDIPFFHSAQYHACSRRLDLENTRVLGEREESVGCEEGLMVWDICDAKFAIYEEVASSDEMEVEAYPKLEGKGKKWLVGASLAADESRVKEMQKDLVECLRKKGKVFSSVYKHGGKEAQPDKHPEIEARRIGGGEWLVVVLVVGEEGMMEKEGLEELVEEWKKEKEGVNIGVWKGEVDML
jgi:hypothetical protein